MANRGRNFPRARGAARKSQWVGPAPQSYVAVASAGATALSTFAGEEPLTIVRTRGNVSIKPASPTADIEITGAVGFGVVSAEALAAGVTAMPEPFSDADWAGWFVWRTFSYDFEFNDATGINYPNWNFELDSKAMRKFGPNEAIVTIAESFSGAFNISVNTRLLLKLS